MHDFSWSHNFGNFGSGSLIKGGSLSSSLSNLESMTTSATGVKSLNGLSFANFALLAGLNRQHPDRLIDSETGTLRTFSKGSQESTPLSHALNHILSHASNNQYLSSLSGTFSRGSQAMSDFISGSDSRSGSKSNSQVDKGWLAGLIKTVGTLTSTSLSGVMQGLKTQILTNPNVQIPLAALAALAIAYPKHEKMLRNINILIAAEEQPKVYTIGLGEGDQERRVSLRIVSGKPVAFVPEPGIKLDKLSLLNPDYQPSGSQSSAGFTSILGFLNVFKYYTQEKITVYNVIVSDPSPASYLKNAPRTTRIELSDSELLQVIQVRASDSSKVFHRLEDRQKSSRGGSSKSEEPDHVQLVTFKVDGASATKEGEIFSLPAFDNKDHGFVRLSVTA